VYGSKVLAVREGSVTLVGQPKRPVFTLLAATASPGDTSIVVEGAVNWVAGAWVGWAATHRAPHRPHPLTAV
jgi:hypothetical protein